MTLTEFLLARIAEDGGYSELVHEFDCDQFRTYDYGSRSGRCDCTAAARVLAECEAKRRIVEDHHPDDLCVALLATVYANHPDYDEAWRV